MNGEPNFDYTHRAVKSNKTDMVFSISAYISAALMYLYPLIIKGVRFVSVLQFCALVCLVCGIYINQRYSWVSYVYGIIPSENKHSGEATGSSFVVYRIQGKRKTTLAMIDMTGIEAVLPCTHKNDRRAEIQACESPTLYNFCATMCPAKYSRAVFRADGGIAVIAFEPDATLSTLLYEYLDKKGADK